MEGTITKAMVSSGLVLTGTGTGMVQAAPGKRGGGAEYFGACRSFHPATVG